MLHQSKGLHYSHSTSKSRSVRGCQHKEAIVRKNSCIHGIRVPSQDLHLQLDADRDCKCIRFHFHLCL